MTTQLHFTRDVAGMPCNGTITCLPFPDFTQSVLLTANTVKAVVVPNSTSSTKLVAYFSFSTGSNVYVQPSASPTLAVPTGTVTLHTYELNPSAREVSNGQHLQLLTTGSIVNVTISYYALPNS